jgi:hypothetical protein
MRKWSVCGNIVIVILQILYGRFSLKVIKNYYFQPYLSIINYVLWQKTMNWLFQESHKPYISSCWNSTFEIATESNMAISFFSHVDLL